MTLTKDRYELNFDAAIDATVLGAEATKDHSDLLLVDFVVEYDDRYLFVEILDSLDLLASNDSDLTGRFRSDALCDLLARMYRDSMFFHSFGDRRPKRVEYAVLYTIPGVDGILVSVLQDELKRRIPLSHPVWNADSAASCSVMTPEQWKKRYGDDAIKKN